MANSSNSTIAVTGCTGFVGRYVTRELLKRGYQVRGLARDVSKAREVFGSPLPSGLSIVTGDCCDARVLSDLVRGCTAVVHLIGIIREDRGEDLARPQSFERMHVQATRAILEATNGAGIKRYVHMSALSVGPEGRSKYQKTKWEAEVSVRRSGLDWTIFRPSLIHGPDGEFVQMMTELCSGEMPPYFFIPYFAKGVVDHRVPGGPVSYEPAMVQPIAVEDVAFAFAQALEKPDSIGEVYNLAGPDALNWRELSELFRDSLHGTNKRLSTWYVPGEHAAVAAKVAGMVGLGKMLPFDEGQALMAMDDTSADITKARVELGVDPKPLRASIEAYSGKM